MIVPREWVAQWPDPQPGVPMFDLLETTWGPGGPPARHRSDASSAGNLVPLLGLPDPPVFPRLRFLQR